ncbi:MAG: RuvX/YqgF family protein [Candidatus Taylorbacteria bacterium]
MRILGIDYGGKRIGVAISDEARQFALPVSVVGNTSLALDEVIKIATDFDTREMVMGESRDYQGKANTILLESLEFKNNLEKKGYIVHLEPEFMTSVAAERFQGKNEFHDASAAALILQSYLDKKRA